MNVVKVIRASGAVGAGFAIGIFLGIAWGKTAYKNSYGSPVSTRFKDGIFTVDLDGGKALKSGLPDILRNL